MLKNQRRFKDVGVQKRDSWINLFFDTVQCVCFNLIRTWSNAISFKLANTVYKKGSFHLMAIIDGWPDFDGSPEIADDGIHNWEEVRWHRFKADPCLITASSPCWPHNTTYSSIHSKGHQATNLGFNIGVAGFTVKSLSNHQKRSLVTLLSTPLTPTTQHIHPLIHSFQGTPSNQPRIWYWC